MKSKMIKIMAAIICTAMIMCCFSSCKNNGDTDGETITKPPVVEGPGDGDMLNLDDFTIPDESGSGEDEPSTDEQTTAPAVTSNSSNTSTVTPTQRPSNNTSSNNQDGNFSTSSSGISQEDIVNLVRTAGYEYDADQKIFYSTMNPWQRHFGFGDEYDQLAPYANMRYKTIKVDFTYHGLLWRIQCWKGQYGVLAGGEMGVYTKDPNNNSTTFYECASDENLLEMEFTYYKSIYDYNHKNPSFTRDLQEHWWLTGFKFGQCDPAKCVMVMTLNARDTAMADGIEAGLKKVDDNKGNVNGFKKLTQNSKGSDFYIREGNSFKILWLNAGYLNYTP